MTAHDFGYQTDQRPILLLAIKDEGEPCDGRSRQRDHRHRDGGAQVLQINTDDHLRGGDADRAYARSSVPTTSAAASEPVTKMAEDAGLGHPTRH